MKRFHELIASLSPQKRALLVARNPLSFAQERLWLVEQLAPGSAAYNVPHVMALEGPLDIGVLRRGLNEIVRRHEVLRTTFAAPDGDPMQVVHPDWPVPLPVIDLGGLEAESRRVEARRWTTAEARIPFDLVEGPLFRCGVLRLAATEHVLWITLHHIVSDGWSLDILVRELITLYRAFSAGLPSPLPELPVQYLDFAGWQREQLQGEALQAQLSYWRQQLAGVPPILDLPTDRPFPRARSYRTAYRVLIVPSALGDELRRLGQRHDATLFVCLLSGFLALLGRLTGQEDLVVGSPVAGRTRSEVEPLIGFFLNLLALRGNLEGDPRFPELLGRMREVVLSAQSHQDLPFEKLVAELQPDRHLQRAPLVQVVFVLLLTRQNKLELPGFSLKPQEVEIGASQYDLSLSMMSSQLGLGARLEYSLDLFEEGTAIRLLSQMMTLLAGVVEEPERRLSELPLLSAAERFQLLEEWGRGEASKPRLRSLNELFRDRVELSGDAEAVSFGEQSLTYRELGRRVDRLAARLHALGVGPETLVALCVERSPAMIVGLWGILAAGGAYLPLDPAHPRERLAFILADSRAAVVVTQEHLAEELRRGEAKVVCLDSGGSVLGDWEDGFRPAVQVDPESLAYAIYTSGSTGRPKGVQIPHRAVIGFLSYMGERLGLCERHRWLAVTTFSFDIAALELALPLLRGACVCIAAPEVAADGARLMETLARERVTVMQATPATWRMLLESGWQGGEGLKVLCGGEALPVEMACQLRERSPQVWNLYGPTETTIWSTLHEVDDAPGPVPIGRPIAGTEVHVLGRRLEIQPVGVQGELFIGGIGLARGYVSRPDLTAERFVPAPFGDRSGARLYRTGDLARFRPDGALEFLGRVDHQVKLRGFRIELGEIEAILAEHARVREAVVLLRQDLPEDPRLTAYVLAANPEPALATALREHLRERLPAYMIPAAVVVLEEWPLTPNGKLDRRALPAPDSDPAKAGGEPLAPRTPLEEQVVGIWADVLGRETVGVEASFFELGGHSLTAARMMHRLRRELDIDLPLPQLFETPTVAGLAAAIARRKADPSTRQAAHHPLPPIVADPENRYEPFPLNEVQQAYWIGRGDLFALGNVASHSYTEIDVEDLDLSRLSRALHRLILRHDMLRAVVLPDGRQQILREVPPYQVQVLDLRRKTPAAAAVELAGVREAMSHQVLSADRWPLFELRATLLEERRTRLHWSLDYLIADAWSIGILFREVFALYEDPERELHPLELSFRDCVLAEQRLAGSDLHRRAERYWQERLPDLAPAPELPLAKDPRLLEKPRFVRRTAGLAAEPWSRLKVRGAQAGLTPSGVLLAAFCEVLGTWSKSPRFTLNVTLFNRPPLHPEINQVIGDFTSLSLLAVDIALEGSFELRARAIQEQLWRDMEHQAVSGVQVLRELARARQAPPDAIMPIVFTSALGQDLGRQTRAAGDDKTGGQVYGISQTPQVWLDHQVAERHGALVFNWDAVEEIFPAGLLDDLFATYGRFLQELLQTQDWSRVGHPELPAAHLALQQAVNATAGPVPAALLHTLFGDRVARQPERPAVISRDRTLTYGELDLRASQLAHRLRQMDIARNELVAVVMEKGWQQVVAVLAILKAGAAYLPIDPDLPRQRLHHLLDRSQARVALIQPWLDRTLDWPSDLERLLVTDEPPLDLPSAPLPTLQGPEDLAYVIYTSGSTGEPKGVMIDHRGAVNTVIDVNERFGVTAEDKILALSALGFDLSVYDFFGLLAAGGCIVMPDSAGLRDPEHWAEWIERHRITIWNSVPALMEMLVTQEAGRTATRLGSLRLALLSGDWLPVSQPDRLRWLAPGIEVVSLGGATEASIWSILHRIGEVDPMWSSIPYGRPMRNQTFHVLDASLEPRPLWVPGELYIGGIGLARGYWRDPEKTAARFITHPLTGERLYRTGDLGRYLPGGEIEFLGREDFQVKIRGYRIELGEVEAALQQIEEVRNAAVAAVGDGDDRRLVAYVVLEKALPGARLPQIPALLREAHPPLIKDEIGKLEFKLSEPGLRRFEAGHPGVNLFAPAPAEELLAPFRARRTYREFAPRPISFSAFSRVMAAFSDCRLLAGRPPVHVWVWVRPGRVEGVTAGTYAYDLKDNRLAPVAPAAELEPQTYDAVNQPVLARSAFSVFFTVRWDGASGGSDAQRHTLLLMAGVLGQALMEEGPAGGIGFCPIGNVDFAGLRPSVGLDSSHVLLHSLLGGAIGDGMAQEDPVDALVKVARSLSFESLSRLLGCLRQWRLPEFPLPKYRYPSAGNLYPVQIYLRFAADTVEGVAPGTYYYHPREHRLFLLSSAVPAPARSGLTLLLVGRRSAIAPIYGGFADDFCRLEMGYMSQLLTATADELGLGLWLAPEEAMGRAAELTLGEDDGGPVQVLACGPMEGELHAALPAQEADAFAESPFAPLLDHDEIIARLRGRLKELLPEYMIPAQFIVLEALPLSANGKVDRKALPAPEDAGRESTTEIYVAPQGDLERTIAWIWQEILGREQVGVNDNFFALGGNSLHLVRCCGRMAEVLGREVRVTELFKHPTVATLARALGQAELPAAPPVESLIEKQKAALRQQRGVAQKRIAHG